MADKDKTSDRVWQKRQFALDQLRLGCEALAKEVDRLTKKIEKEGLEGYYSINSDLLRWARQAHSACYELSILRSLQVYIDDDCGIIRELGKENQHGTQNQTSSPGSSDGRGTAQYACSCREGAGSVLRERRRPKTVEASTTSNCRQAQARQQAQVPREGAIVKWRLEALALIATGLIMGVLLFGTP